MSSSTILVVLVISFSPVFVVVSLMIFNRLSSWTDSTPFTGVKKYKWKKVSTKSRKCLTKNHTELPITLQVLSSSILQLLVVQEQSKQGLSFICPSHTLNRFRLVLPVRV